MSGRPPRPTTDPAPEGSELFRRVADDAPVLMWMTDADRQAVWFNRPWLEFTGRTLDEELGGGWAAGIHPGEVAAYQKAFSAAFEARRPFQIDYRLHRHDGTYHWVLDSGIPMTDPGGRFTGFIGSCVDINDRREAAARNSALLIEVSRRSRQLDQLASASRRVNAVLEAPVILRRLVAGAREIVDATGGYAGLVADGRLTAEEYDDRGALRRVALSAGPDDRGVPRYVLRAAAPYMSDDAALDAVINPEMRDRFAIQTLIALPVLDRAGAVVAYVELHNKRGGRPFDPDDLRALEGLASAAAIALENARLFQEVQAAARRKEEYLAMLAHELRNPLVPVWNALHVLDREGSQAGLAAEARQTIRRQVRHLTGIVDDLLDVSRAHRGGLAIHKARIELGPVVGRAVEALRGAAAEAGLLLTVDSPPDPVPVEGDAARLTQVFENLIHNAIKFTPAGGAVAVELTADGESAHVRVRDTGVGLAPEMIPRLFEVFSQADRSLDRPQGGLGLGLALVKGLADLHGGTVTAESAGLGHGSLFTIRLPLAEPEPGSVPCRRVLIVEDSRDAADSLKLLLELSGYEVTAAATGPAGLAQARTVVPDVVICDIGLPGLSGYEVAAALRKDSATRGIRLLAVSGYGRPEDLRKAREAGFTEHMTKPMDPSALLKWLGPPT